jgi:hypothetical protein
MTYAVEVEVLNEERVPDRGDLFLEAAKAYRARREILRAAGKDTEAAVDEKRAAKLETDGKQLAAELAAKKKAAQPAALDKPAQLDLTNRTEPNQQRDNSEPKRRGFRIFR